MSDFMDDFRGDNVIYSHNRGMASGCSDSLVIIIDNVRFLTIR